MAGWVGGNNGWLGGGVMGWESARYRFKKLGGGIMAGVGLRDHQLELTSAP